MSKFKSLLEAHQAEAEQTSPQESSSAPVAPVAEKSTPKPQPSTTAPNASLPAWIKNADKETFGIPPVKWIKNAAWVVVGLVILHFARLFVFGYGDVKWKPPVVTPTASNSQN